MKTQRRLSFLLCAAKHPDALLHIYIIYIPTFLSPREHVSRVTKKYPGSKPIALLTQFCCTGSEFQRSEQTMRGLLLIFIILEESMRASRAVSCDNLILHVHFKSTNHNH